MTLFSMVTCSCARKQNSLSTLLSLRRPKARCRALRVFSLSLWRPLGVLSVFCPLATRMRKNCGKIFGGKNNSIPCRQSGEPRAFTQVRVRPLFVRKAGCCKCIRTYGYQTSSCAFSHMNRSHSFVFLAGTKSH